MNPVQSILLGLVQGLTEFLPVSSSAHLILLRPVLGFGDSDLWFDVLLHGGTLIAVLLFMIPQYHRLWKKPAIIWFVILATIPAGIFGTLFESSLENQVRNNYGLIAVILIVVGFIFFFIKERGNRYLEEMNWSSALLIGLSQALALIPGVSRSGITLIVALLLGFRRTDAVFFSFLLSITTIGGAFIKGLMEVHSGGQLLWATVLPGFIVSFFSGLIACFLLLKIVQNTELKPFGYYRILFGTICLVYFLFSIKI